MGLTYKEKERSNQGGCGEGLPFCMTDKLRGKECVLELKMNSIIGTEFTNLYIQGIYTYTNDTYVFCVWVGIRIGLVWRRVGFGARRDEFSYWTGMEAGGVSL